MLIFNAQVSTLDNMTAATDSDALSVLMSASDGESAGERLLLASSSNIDSDLSMASDLDEPCVVGMALDSDEALSDIPLAASDTENEETVSGGLPRHDQTPGREEVSGGLPRHSQELLGGFPRRARRLGVESALSLTDAFMWPILVILELQALLGDVLKSSMYMPEGFVEIIGWLLVRRYE